MNTAIRVGVYAAALTVVFAGAWGAGSLMGPLSTATAAATDGSHNDDHGEDQAMAGMSMTADEVASAKGLAITDHGYTLDPLTDNLTAAAAGTYRFRVLGPDGAPVTAFTASHDKDLHLIVVHRDLSGFQHLHPQLTADGTWTVPVTVAAPGTYRVFADFVPAGWTGDSLTLGADLQVPGDAEPVPLPDVSRTATVNGYTVTRTGELTAGESSPLTFTVSRDGVPVTDLQPYLAAYGHLVALRQGDLGYLHVHPGGAPSDGVTPAGPDIDFQAEVPTPGTYRLYLDFAHGGAVHTAEFTVTA